MVIRLASVVLTLAGLLALASGILFWTGLALNFMTLHMMLGLLTVAALWTIAIAQATAPGGSWLFAACALLVGALAVILGLYQSSFRGGSLQWIVQVIHLLLGILTIGLGHMGAARYRRAARSV